MAMAASSPQSTAAAAAKSGLNDPEAIIARLNDTKADRKTKIAVASEIKDQSETVYNNGDYPRFLKAIVPAYTSLLSNTPCAFTSESPEHKLRHILLETLHRLYPSEAARPFASSLMTCMLEVVRSDNEENAVQALKIIIDLHRTHKAVLEEHVQPFLNLVQTLYTNMKDTVKEAFGEAKEGGTTGQSSDSPMAAPSPAGESAAGSEGPLAATASSSGPRTLVKSLNSFKVLTECPIAVVLIFQSYRAVVPAALQLFVPLIVQQCLLLEAAPQAEAHAQAAAKGEIFVGVAPSIAAKNRSVFTDMVVAQVKSMSFLAYVIRGSASVMRPHANVLPVVSVRLLKDCPPESAGTRKELLVAIRHLLGTDFRATFVSQLDALLDKRVNILVGTGVTSYETHRPLAISMLADLVHHVRNELNPTQLERVVAMHTQILHDSTIAPSIQTMCVKLLLNLVDTICNKFPVPTEKDQTDQAAVLLRTMMNAFVEKTGSLARLREDIENARAQHRWEREEKAKEKEASSSSSSSAITTTSTSTSTTTSTSSLNGVVTSASPSTKTPVEEKREIMAIDSVAIERAKPIQAAAVLQDPVSDLLKDARFLFRNILLGFKSLLSHLKSRNAIQPDGELMGRLFVNVVKCWSLHDGRDSREEKDILDNFTNLLTDAPPQIFHEVFTRHLPFLFEATKQNHSLLGIAQNLLSNDATSSRFVAILLRFLVANDHLSKLGEPDKKHVNVSLRLFKMSFMAVTIFPEENEAVLQPHLSHLIMTSIRFAAAAQEPTNYFLLLRALFRSIGGGKFELLYEDVLPLLPVLLENLNALLASAEGAMEASVSGASSSTAARRELFVDLCLTVPVRLNVLLPYLGYLMRPLVLALQSRSSPELVSQGLRTLELCIDNLTQEFLDPIMAPYSNDIMAALWSHLAPLPHNHQHSHTTMRILGKMGGRNRRGLQDPPKLAYTQQPPNNKEQVWTMSLEGKLQNMPLAPIIEVALANVKRTDVYYRRHAFQLLSSAAAILLETVVSSSTLSNSSNPNFLGTAVAPNSDAERTGQLELVIRGLFEATRGEDLQEEATTFLLNFARHAFEFELGREMPLPAGTSPRHLTFLTTALFDGIAQTLAQADSADLSSFVEIERAIILDLKDACDGNASPVPKMPDSSSEKDGEKTCTSEEKKENQVEGKEKGKGKASSSSKSTKSGQSQSTSTSSSTLPNGSSSSSSTSSPATRPDIFQTLMHSLMSKHCTHCYSSHWARKTGGWAGVDMLLRRTNASKSWIREHQLEAVRALLFMLKDMPSDPPGNVKEVSDTLLFFLQEANARSEKDEQLDLEVEKEKQEAREKEENEKKNGENTEDSEKEKEKDVKKEKDGEKGKEESKDKEKEKNGSEAEKPSDNSAAVKKPSLPPPGSAAEQKLVQDRQFQYLTGILVPELSASNSHVREVTRKAFELLAVQRGVSVTDILLQVKDRLLVPIFQKPLRALPFGMQIGYIDAITYALQLRPPLPDFNEELARVLTEALALVNAEDNTLVGRAQHTQYKNMLSVTKIRVVAIRLLASAMACPAFSKMPMPPDTSMKMNIISVYFKSLYSRSDEIVQVAYASLKDTLQGQAKLPKDVLQSGLRPILMTLADSGRLTPHGLGGLANLLELLTSYFKVEIGQKLLSHMTAIAEAEALRVASKGALTGPSYSDAHHLLRPVPVRESDCVETLAAVTRVFHLLPPAAVNFMNDLVQRVLLIEDQLHRSGPTPFTKPLAQFFNKFPAESTTYLFGKLEDPRYVRCLRLTLAEEAAPNLREYISQNKETVLLPLFGEEAEPKKALAGLFVIKVLIESDSNWVSENKDVFEALIAHWASPACEKRRLESADTCAGEGSRENNEIVQLTDVFCSFLAHEPNVDAYFQLVDVFTYRIAIDRNPLVRFVDQHLALGAPVSFCRQILERFMQVFENKEIDQAYKIQALRVLVNPMIFTSFQSKVRKIKRQTTVKPEAGDSDGDTTMQDGTKTIQSKEAEEAKEKAEDQEEEELFDAALITQIVNRIWKPFQSKAHILAAICSDDSLRIELLHMSSMILEHCSQLLSPAGPARKDTIKFGWANLTAEDVTVKNAAYIFIARFLDAFESPIKIVGQVYLGLLRTHQPEGRAMVRKALDILVPVLPRRTGPVEPGQPPLWARWTKRQLIDEGHNTSQLFAILSVIVRHPDLFYPVRDMFLPQIAASLTKLSLIPTSTSAESRYLTIELIDMIASWEKRRQKVIKAEAESANPSSNADPDSTVETGSSRKRAEEETEEPRSTRKRARIDTAGTSSTSTPTTTTATTSTQPAAATSTSAAANGGEHSYVLPPNLCESVVGALVRFVSLSADPISRGGVVGKAFGLLEELTSEPFWPDVEIKLDSLRRPLAVQELNDANVNILCNALQVLQSSIKGKDDQWILDHLAQLRKLLERSLSADSPPVLDAVKPILERIFLALPDTEDADADGDGDADGDADEEMATTESGSKETKTTRTANGEQSNDEAAEFLKSSDSLINEGLSSQTRLYATFVTLDAWAQKKPEKIDQFLIPLTKALTKLTKEHLSAQAPVSPNDQGLKLLIKVLDLLKLRISNLGDQRRWFLSALVQLVERSTSLDLCRFLLLTMSKWILGRKEMFPTVKEKAGILVKMMSYESRDNDQLLRDYLDLIHSIYTTPAFARTELTVRLENAFLLGCRHRDPHVRQRFIDIFDRTLVNSLSGRLQYLLGTQSWEYLADHYWIQQSLDLLLGSAEGDRPVLNSHSPAFATRSSTSFTQKLRSLSSSGIVSALRALLYTDKESAHKLWVLFFKAAWRVIPRKSQEDVSRTLIALLTREYNLRQVGQRPNVAQTLLQGALACTPQPELPPHVVKYIGKSFNAWYTAAEVLQNLLRALPREDDAIREAGQDALAELYAELSEDDLFYGLWRRRCVYAETNTAISYEQNGMWAQAQIMYEGAQIKARTGVLSFTEAEYSLWEDHWVICAQNLQQWDILTDLAKLEGDTDLLLECAWRLSDWTNEREVLEQALESVSATSTPRRRVFEAYMALLKSQSGLDRPAEFGRICDEAIQLTLRKWHSLPTTVTQAHVPLLQIFQQFVELQEASTVFASLANTTAQNLDQRSTDLKTLMLTWRERLPNKWDDINSWSDLVAWRQHVFGAVNKAYLPLVPMIASNGANGSSTNSYAYRGYHETAWIINRFAHVARKHYLNDVCISSLTKIYTLPNIEIQEAFLKLREQAKCHYQNQNELAQGLEVINNTNLMFFAAPQKAEFFTLKGMFMAKLGLLEEANHSFATAIQMDLTLAKAWCEWGRYHDRNFRDFCQRHNQNQNQDPTQAASAAANAQSMAANAVHSYLQAASLYKSSKTRKVLIRILWLLSCDDSQGKVAKAFEDYRGETPIWYWITFIPQLLQSLSFKEARYARMLLMQIAKTYPQSLYYHLRTAKEDLMASKRQAMMIAQRARQLQSQQGAAGSPAASGTPDPSTNGAANAASPEAQSNSNDATNSPKPQQPQQPRQAWEHVDEILNILKTAFPLLALTMESVAEQIQQRFKPSTEEDIYRLTNALLNDALLQYIQRATVKKDDGALPESCRANVSRFAENIPIGSLKTSFEEDFIKTKPNLREYVQRLQRWRDRYESILDRRASRQHLEHCSHYLVEFQHQKFDEVEVPGQYLRFEDNNSDFVKIARFLPIFDLIRSSGMCSRRITILSNKGSKHMFTVQLPSARHCRREEKLFQLLRLLNRVLERRKETRKRGLVFHTPTAVPLAPTVRLIDYDSSFVSLQDIYERHCEEIGIGKDDPLIAWVEKMRSTWDHSDKYNEYANLRMELLDEISTKMVPETVLSKYMTRCMATPSDLWLMRKHFTLQWASNMFLTYVLFVSSRLPNRIHISRSSGQVTMSDLVPTLNPQLPQFKSTDATPFRLSINIQNFIGPIGIEGVLTSSLMAIGRCLSEPEYDLEEYLSIFVRDEINFWYVGAQRQAPGAPQEAPKEIVMSNAREMVKRARILSCKHELDKMQPGSTPVSQTVLDLINTASNPVKLSQQDPTWAPWL